jgi:hypothetical protein
MRRSLIGLVAAGLMLAAVPTAGATPGNGNGQGAEHSSSAAAKACAAQKKADPAAFRAVWGKHAMRDCIRAGRGEGMTETPAEAAEEFQNAAQECRAQRDADPVGFATTWGTNANDRNAFGKCVSATVHAAQEG